MKLNSKTILASSVYIVPIITAVLFFMGRHYQSLRFYYWHLDPDLFPYSVATNMYYGIFVVAHAGFKNPLFAAMVLTSLFLIFYLIVKFTDATGRYLRNKWKPLYQLGRRKKKNNKRQMQSDFSRFIVFYGISIFMIFLASIFIGIVVFILNGIVNSVAVDLEKCNRANYDAFYLDDESVRCNNNPVYIETFEFLKKPAVEGMVIDCSSNYCAVYQGSGKRVVFSLDGLLPSSLKLDWESAEPVND